MREQMVQSPWRLAALVPCTVSQGHFHSSQSLTRTSTFPNLGVFDLPEFWFSYSCLVYVTVHYFRNGCQLSKEAVGELKLMGKLQFKQNHRVLTKLSRPFRNYVTSHTGFEQLWIISHFKLSFLSFYSSATVAPFFPK